MLRRTLRRLRFALFAAITTVVIALAVLVGLTQLAMPWLVRNPDRIEAFLSERLHKPVRIGHVSGRWFGGGPLLTLEQVSIGAANGATPPLEVPRAELAIDLYAPFVRGRAWSEFRLIGLDVEILRADDGRWQLRGFDLGDASSAATPEGSVSMGPLGALVLKDLKLTVHDPRDDLDLALGASELRVANRGDVMHVAGRVRNLAVESPSPVELIADVDIEHRSGTVYVGGADIDLAGFAAGHPFGGVEIEAGRGVAEIWARVRDGRVDDLRVRADLAGAVFSGAAPVAADRAIDVEPRTHLDRLALLARWLRVDAGWSLDVADLSFSNDAGTAPARISIDRSGGDAPRIRAAAANLPIEPVGSLAMLIERVPAGLRRWLYLAHPRGEIARAAVDWRDRDAFDVEADLRSAGFESAGLVPGVERLDARIDGDAEALMLALPKASLRVDYPHVFRKPFEFSAFGGDIVAFRTDDAWRIATDRLAFEAADFGGELRGGAEIQDDGSRPLLDLYAVVTHADVPAAKRFWPTNVMPPKAVEWLDRALVGGSVEEGRAVVRGDLDSWPFHDDDGRFEARAHVSDTTFVYSDEWPRAEHLSAVASFVDDSLEVTAESADIKGNRLASATAKIPDLSETVLDLSARGSGSGASLLDFLRATPVGARYEDTLKDVAIGGKGEVAFTLTLPIKDMDRLALDGNVDLSGANLDDAAYDLHFVDASGKVHFDQRGFAAGPLAVQFRQRPAKLSLAAGGGVADPAHALEASLTGRFAATTAFADVHDLDALLSHTSGEADWRASLAIDRSESGDGAKRLAIASDLRGIAFDLPAPLAKPADAAWPFVLNLALPPLGQPFDAKLGDVATIRGRLPAPNAPLAVRVELGAASSAPLPARGIAISGRAGAVDAGGWLDFFEHPGPGEGGGGSALDRIDVDADAFKVAGRDFGATHVALANDNGTTVLTLDGADVAGSLRIPGATLAREGVTARFQRFHWPEAPAGTPDEDSGALADVAPGSLPPLHIAVDDFRLGSASFGAAQFESYPTPDGMHVDRLESRSPNVNMSASGDWTGSATKNASHLAIAMTAQNLGHMMDALGFPGLIDGGQTSADIDAVWPGPPSAFALPRLESGTIALKVGEGRILDVEPGAGRIFGLFSLTEIPRRLSLDFSDIFRSGFTFNSIGGEFRLDDGNAYTSNLLIKSPAADVRISGRTGLRAKDYDQQMVVTPHTSATLPVVGALAGGPVGAAAGIVLQSVLGKPLGKAMASRYQVSGTWDKPKITLIGRERSLHDKDDDAAPTPPADTGADSPRKG